MRTRIASVTRKANAPQPTDIVSVDMLKADLRISYDAEDALISNAIEVAYTHFEQMGIVLAASDVVVEHLPGELLRGSETYGYYRRYVKAAVFPLTNVTSTQVEVVKWNRQRVYVTGDIINPFDLTYEAGVVSADIATLPANAVKLLRLQAGDFYKQRTFSVDKAENTEFSDKALRQFLP